MRTWWLGLVIGGCAAAAFGACSSRGADAPGGGDGGGGGNSGGGNTSGSGNHGGNGTGAVTFIDAATGGRQQDADLGDSACAAAEEGAHLTTVNLVFMIDKSGSMGDDHDHTPPAWTNQASRWDPAQAGLLAFFREPGSSHLYAAMDFFAADGDALTACNPAQYQGSTFTIPLTSLENNQIFVDTLANTSPQGGTPTWPAMRGALDYATDLALADLTSKTIVVLVTDGTPGLNILDPGDAGTTSMREACQEIGAIDVPNTVDEVATIVRQAYEASPQILTYVFGITSNAIELQSLNTIARAGSGDQENATIIETTDAAATATQLQTKLSAIRTNSLTCDMPIPHSPSGEPLDPTMVNVYVNMDGQRTPLVKNVGCSAPVVGDVGWHYDNDANPTRITLCPRTCDAVQGNASATLSVAFGCASFVP